MNLSVTLEKAFNNQLNLELYSSYIYHGMEAYFATTPYEGFAKWMGLQRKEESEHADKFFNYIVDRGGKVNLQAIGEPKCDYPSPLAVFQAALKHEQLVSASIGKLYEIALTEKDYASLVFLQWFLTEQVEEEKNVSDLVTKLEIAGDNRNAIFQVDKLAGKRNGQSC